jgi:hypothetical protein
MASPHVAGVAAQYLQSDFMAVPLTVANAIINNASLDVIKNPGNSSPNRLLFSQLVPVIYYDFEDNFDTSQVVKDKSGNSNDINVQGNVVKRNEGIKGNCIEFSGTNSFLKMDRNPTKGFKEITVSLFFKTTQPSANYKLASTAWWHGGPGNGWILGTHYPEMWDNNGNSIRLSSEGWNDVTHYFVPNEWNHIVLTYDGSRMKEYINGEKVVDHSTTGVVIGDGSGIFSIGEWVNYGFTYSGLMDEFKIYSTALSSEEIKQIYISLKNKKP